ncbi:MAG: CPBP family intramembrane metalloprotease [Planctomycetes bacterium]|nr:CPBP family intramembrane metalloprotease [Planctomycetota bacterium]
MHSESVGREVARIVTWGAIGGVAVAITFELLTRVFFHQHLAAWNAPCRFHNWRTYISAAIGAAVGEESVFRLLLFPLVAWVLGLLWKTPSGLPADGAMWVSLVVVTLLFAASHLPALEDLGGYRPGNIMRGMLVFSPPGLMLGFLFWRHGLETAMIAHATGLVAGWSFVSTLAELK